jgi:hypothetical protein
MPKGLKIVLIIILILLTLIGSLFIYVYQNIDQLKNYALKEVNQILKAELKAESIDVSFMQTFPNVSLAFHNISIADPIIPSKFVLQAKSLYLGFDIYDVVNEKYKIHLVDLDSGTISLYTDKKGRNNFDLLKETNADSKMKKPFTFEMNKLKLNQIQLLIDNKLTQFKADVFVEESNFSGKFSDKRFNLNVLLKGHSNSIQSGTLSLMRNKDLLINTVIDIDQEKNKYQLVKGEFSINQLIVSLTGWVQNDKNEIGYNLSFKANKISIQNLLSTLPFKLPESLLAYKSEGNVFFNGAIIGIQKANSLPRIKIEFGIENGSLTEPESKMKLEDITLNGSFDNGIKGQLKDAVIAIPNLQATLVGSKIKGNLNLSNLESPTLNIDINGNANLNTLHTFFKFEDVKKIVGELQFTLTLKGEKRNNTWDWSSPLNKGLFKVELNELSLNYLTATIQNATLKAELSNNTLKVQEAKFAINQSDILLNGNVQLFMDFLVQPNAPFIGNFNMQSQSLDTKDVFIYDSSDPLEEGEKPIQYQIELKLSANKFVFDLLHATNFKTDLSLSSGHIVFSNTNMNVAGGSLTGNGDVYLESKQTILKSTNTIKGININQLMKEFNNFGQNEFTHKNLFGTLNASTEMRLILDEKSNLLSDKILVVTDMNIKNGELVNYEPLNALSKFVDVNELKNLKFSELKNTLTIQNKVLNIPTMDIRNNALNLNLTGSHTFENVLDYNVKLSLSELLKKKRKPKTNEFEEEDEKTKGINLYLRIKGPINKLSYEFDKRGAKAQLKQDVKQEKEAIKEILKKEFGIKKDTSLKKVEKKNENNDELEFEAN